MTPDETPYVRSLGWRRPEPIEPMRLRTRQPIPWRLWVTVGSYVAAVAVAGLVTLWALLK